VEVQNIESGNQTGLKAGVKGLQLVVSYSLFNYTTSITQSTTSKMSSTTDYKFEGWAGIDDKATKGGMVFKAFTPKAWDEDDIDGEFGSRWV
jgi:hypothetical protein